MPNAVPTSRRTATPPSLTAGSSAAPACWNDGSTSSDSSGSATHVCRPASVDAIGRASSGERSEWTTPNPAVIQFTPPGSISCTAPVEFAVDHRPVEEVRHRRQTDVWVGRDVGAAPGAQLLRPDEVGEDERPDHPPGVEGQQPIHVGGTDAPTPRRDHTLDGHRRRPRREPVERRRVGE